MLPLLLSVGLAQASGAPVVDPACGLFPWLRRTWREAVRRPCGCSCTDGEILTMGKVNQRVEIFILRYKRRPASLAEVYGDEPVPLDTWGNPFVVVPAPGEPRAYDLVSFGADGLPGTRCGWWKEEDLWWSDVR